MKKCIFWTKVAHQVSTFWTFHCLSEVVQILMIFETRSQFLYKLCTIFQYLKHISAKCKWNFLETQIESVAADFNAASFWCSLFFKNISTPRLNREIGKQCCLPPLSFKIILRDASFHIPLNSLGFYLSPECLLNFLWLEYVPPCVEIFNLWCSHS